MPTRFVVALHLLIPLIYCVVFFGDDAVIWLGEEDGFSEATGAAAFLISSFLLIAAFIVSKGRGNDFGFLKTNRNVFFLLLAIPLFFAGGEEISWGQRIFGWSTPESLKEINAQDETTLHNLEFFQSGGFHMYMAFNIFWLAYCVAFPLAYRFVGFVRKLVDQWRVPVPPIWVGTLLLVCYAVYPQGEVRHSLNEIKEANSAYAFAFLGLVFFLQAKAGKSRA